MSHTFQRCFKDIKEVSNLQVGMHWYFHKLHIIYSISKTFSNALPFLKEKSHVNMNGHEFQSIHNQRVESWRGYHTVMYEQVLKLLLSTWVPGAALHRISVEFTLMMMIRMISPHQPYDLSDGRCTANNR